jgi:hypothetical protein
MPPGNSDVGLTPGEIARCEMHLTVLPQYTAALRLRLPFKRASTHALVKLLCFPRLHDGFISMSITPNPDEISLFCDREDASVLFPEGAIEMSAVTWRVMRVMSGLADIDSVGSIERLTAPLASGGIPINYISTVDTDYVLVEDRHLERAIELLATTKSIYVEYAEDSPVGGLSGDKISSPPRGSFSSDHTNEDLQPCSPSARTFSCYKEPVYLAKLAKGDLRVSTHTILEVFVMDETRGAFRSITITEDEVRFSLRCMLHVACHACWMHVACCMSNVALAHQIALDEAAFLRVPGPGVCPCHFVCAVYSIL